jgi:hypothetical protein
MISLLRKLFIVCLVATTLSGCNNFNTSKPKKDNPLLHRRSPRDNQMYIKAIQENLRPRPDKHSKKHIENHKLDNDLLSEDVTKKPSKSPSKKGKVKSDRKNNPHNTPSKVIDANALSSKPLTPIAPASNDPEVAPAKPEVKKKKMHPSSVPPSKENRKAATYKSKKNEPKSDSFIKVEDVPAAPVELEDKNNLKQPMDKDLVKLKKDSNKAKQKSKKQSAKPAISIEVEDTNSTLSKLPPALPKHYIDSHLPSNSLDDIVVEEEEIAINDVEIKSKSLLNKSIMPKVDSMPHVETSDETMDVLPESRYKRRYNSW